MVGVPLDRARRAALLAVASFVDFGRGGCPGSWLRQELVYGLLVFVDDPGLCDLVALCVIDHDTV